MHLLHHTNGNINVRDQLFIGLCVGRGEGGVGITSRIIHILTSGTTYEFFEVIQILIMIIMTCAGHANKQFSSHSEFYHTCTCTVMAS